MKKENRLSRAYLETLSSAELIKLADEYGIDIPDDLNRQFIIGELIEVGEELQENSTRKETIILSDTQQELNVDTLPQTYNETRVNAVLRNPVSLFVWWDLSESVLRTIRADHSQIQLCVYFFDDEADEKPSGDFKIQVSISEREQYVIVPGAKKFVRIDLCAECDGKTDTLAFTKKIAIPQGSKILCAKPGEKLDVPRILTLSGASEMLKKRYNQYRQSFDIG